MNKLTIDEIEVLLRHDELSLKELASVLASTNNSEGIPENIALFNTWIRDRYDFSASYHKRLKLENIEISNVNLVGLDLRYTEIINCAFTNCDLSDSSFWDSTIKGCRFWGGSLDGANFRGSTIDNTKFDSVSLSGQVCFIESNINDCLMSIKKSILGELDFTRSNIQGLLLTSPTVREGKDYAIIDPTGLDDNKVMAKVGLHSLEFTYAIMENVKVANLHIYNFIMTQGSIVNSDIINVKVENNLVIVKSHFSNVRVKMEFFDSLFRKMKNKIREGSVSEIDYIIISSIHDNYKSINDLYSKSILNRLKKNSLRSMKLQEFKKISGQRRYTAIGSYASLSILKYVSDYGESPSRVFWWMSGVIFGVAGLSSLLSWTEDDSLFTNLYFSIITFSTVGYGEVLPTHEFGRFVFALEGLSGIFLMSMFVVSLAKKWLDD